MLHCKVKMFEMKVILKKSTCSAQSVFFTFSLLLASCSLLFAQGSLYSQFGLGEIVHPSTAQSFAMGGIGTASKNKSSLEFFSPAVWSVITQTKFSLGMNYQGITVKDNLQSAFYGKGKIANATLALPVYTPKGIVVGAGFFPVTSMDYARTHSDIQHGIAFTNENTGIGGLSLLFLGSSYKPNENISLGIQFNYLFGTIDHTETFISSAVQSLSTRNTISRHNAGNGVTFSSLIDIPAEMCNVRKLNFGISFTPQILLTSSNDSLYEYFSGSVVDTSPTQKITAASNEFRTKIPTRIAVGLSSKLNERTKIGTDFELQQWKNFTVDGIHPDNFENSFHFALGGEYINGGEKSGVSYTDRIAYRLGFSYSKTPLKIFGKSISEIGVSGGFGFPLEEESRLNIGMQYVLRGTTSNNLLQENIFRFAISIDGSETMFVQRQEE